MTNKVNQSSRATEELVDVPMIIDKNSIAHYKKLGYKVQSYLLGNRKAPCVYVKGTQNFKNEYIRMMDTERKAEDRKSRCLIADGKGGRIMCPECNKCSECKKKGEFNFTRNYDLSYEKLVEGDTEEDRTFDIPDPTDALSDLLALNMINELIADVSKYNVDFGQMLKMLYDQKGTFEIAKELNIPWSTAKDKIKKVQKLAQELYGEK